MAMLSTPLLSFDVMNGEGQAYRDEPALKDLVRKFEEMVTTRNQADGMIHAVKKTLAEAGDKATAEEKTKLDNLGFIRYLFFFSVVMQRLYFILSIYKKKRIFFTSLKKITIILLIHH